MFFLHIAAQVEPVDISSVGKVLDLSKAACSRNYYRLSCGLRDGNEGLALIEAQDDPTDYRRKLLVLTAKGVVVALELTEFIADNIGRNLQNANQE
jgi:DNA-binding MarR family transcriptional regulator